MKYINVILIIIALLNNNVTFNAENTMPLQIADEVSNEQKEKIELSDIQQWDNHLELLTIKGEYWNATDNIPNDRWQNDAFDIAEKIIKNDKNNAEKLKTSFFDAIKTKIALEKGEFTKETTSLISEFDKLVESLLSKEPIEESKEIVSTPTTPEISMTPVVTQEPVSEVSPVATEAYSYQGETTLPTFTATEPVQPKNLKSEWKTVLESIKQDESIISSINKAHELTTELLLSGQGNPVELEKEFNAALTTRIDQKQLNPLAQDILNTQRTLFKMNIAQQIQPAAIPTSSYPMVPTTVHIEQQREMEKQQKQAFEKLQAEYAQKNAQLKEEWEKQRKKEEQEKMKVLAAAAKAEQEGTLAKEQLQQIHYSVQAKKERDRLIEEKLKEELAQITKAREELTKNIQNLAQAQAMSAEKKGIFSTFTDAISDWWYGSSAEKPTKLTIQEQEKFLTALVQNAKDKEAAKRTFQEFQQMLLNFNAMQWWNPQKEMPNTQWINRMQYLMKEMVIEHKIISTDELSNIIKSVISTKVRNYQKIIAAIKKLTQEEQIKQKQQILETQARLERKREKKEQIILAQQKRKEAEENKIAEEKKQKDNIIQYKKEKDEWYDLLYKVASNKKATHQDNFTDTHHALQKSQSLLQLANNIPTKNKSALSQKLKQKFSVALLEQQKHSQHDLNIYHNMDIFNDGVNKIME